MLYITKMHTCRAETGTFHASSIWMMDTTCKLISSHMYNTNAGFTHHNENTINLNFLFF